LGTTGPLHQSNDQKEVSDDIKAGYGLMAMLHTIIGRLYFYGGDLEMFKEIGASYP
jgi:hypothetical protein